MAAAPLTTELLNRQLDAIFSPILDTDRNERSRKLDNAIVAFENLCGFYIDNRFGHGSALAKELIQAVQFDHLGIAQMLSRFQRDAFGVMRFRTLMSGLVATDKLNEETSTLICDAVSEELSIRINAYDPRKTRVAAAFSLWMANFRPLSIKVSNLSKIDSETLVFLCPLINFWITTSYLSKFGDINLGEDAPALLERIRHDLLVRELRLSPLETFYAGIFRKRTSIEEFSA